MTVRNEQAKTFSNSNLVTARRSRRRTVALAVGALTAMSVLATAHGATVFWDPDATPAGNTTAGAGIGGTGNWNTTTLNWWTSGQNTADAAWVSGNIAEITGAATSLITVTAPVNAGGILAFTIFNISGSSVLTLSGNVQVSGNASFISAPIAGGGFSSNGGTLVLAGANTFTGTYTINSGQVNLNSSTAMGTATFVINAGSIDTNGQTMANNNAQTWNGNFTFLGSGNLNMGTGAVSLGSTAGSRTVTVNANTMTVGGIISNGTATGLTKAGAGALVLGGSNSYTGGTTISAGTLELTSTGLLASTSLTLGQGATLIMDAGQGGANFTSGTTLNTGAVSTSTSASGMTGTLALGAVTRNTGSTIDFGVLPTAGSITTTTANASFTGGQQSILGGYATVGGSSWAVSGTGGTAGAISSLPTSSYGTTFIAGTDVDAPSGLSTPGSMTINSLRFNASGGSTVADSGAVDTFTIATGGILEASGVGANAVTISAANLTSANGGDLIVIQNNPSAAMTINSNISGGVGLTKTGTGALILASSYTGVASLGGSGAFTQNGPGTITLASTNSAFTGGLIINSGQENFSAATGLGAAGNAVTLNGGILSYTGTGNTTVTQTLAIGASGGTLSSVNSGLNGGGAKVQLSTTGQLTGSGPLTVSGPGIVSMSAANSAFGGAWIINGGFVETSNATALGAVSVPVTVNAGGEWANKGIADAHNVTLSGGTIGNDSSTINSFTGSINVTAASKIRLGDFFDGSNQPVGIAGPISGSGNLTLINANGGTGAAPSNANPLGTPGAPSNQILSLSGNNAGFSGTLITDAGHDVRFINATSVVPTLVRSTTTALPLIIVQFNGVPAFTQDSTGTGEGVFGTILNNTSTAFNMSTIGGGSWYFGTDSTNVSYFGVLTPGNGNTYRLSGGGGALFLGSGDLTSAGNGGAIIGDTRVGGTGTVKYGNVQSYTGNTTVNAGSTLFMDFLNSGTANITNLMPGTSPLILNGGTFTDGGRNSVALSQTVAGTTINPGGNNAITAVNTATSNTIIFKLGVITRNIGGTVNFTNPANGTISAANNGIVTNTPNANGTILGGYATFGGTTWAVSAGTAGTPGLISGLATFSGTPFTSGGDTDAAAATVTPGTVSINSLRFNTVGAATINDTSSNTLTIASGGILETGTVGANAVTFNIANLASGNGQDLIVINNNAAANPAMTINSLIGGTQGLTKSGVGGLILGGPDTFSGITSLNGGAITLTNGLALQNSTVSFNLQAGTLLFGGAVTSASVGGLIGNQSLSLSNTNATPAAVALTVGNTASNPSTTYSGNMTGLGSLIKAGTGTLTLTGSNNNYIGGTAVNAGTLKVNGAITGTGAVNVNSTGTLAGTGTIAGPVTVAGGSTSPTQGNISLVDGAIGTLTLQNGLTVGDASNPASLSFDINASTADKLALGSSVFTVNAGGATIHVNSLVIGSSIVSGTTYTLMTFGSGTGAGFATGMNTSVGSLSLANPILTFGVTGSLNASNTALQVVTSVTAAPGTAYWSGVQGTHWTDTDGTLTNGNFSNDSGGVNFVHSYPAANTDVLFAASGNGAPANLANTLGANFDINSLTFLTGTGATNIGGTQQLKLEAAGISGGVGINVQNGAGAVTLSMANLVLGSSQTWNSSSATPVTITSNVSGAAALVTNGNFLLSGFNNYSGGLTVNSGTAQFGVPGSLNTAGGLTVNSTVDLNGTSAFVGNLNGASTGVITNGAAAPGNSLLTTNTASSGTFAGVISDNGTGKNLGLVKNGAAALTLSGSNTYTGGTTINAGTLVVGNANALSAGPVTGGGGTLDLNAAGSGAGGAQAVSIGSLSGRGTITDNNSVAGLTTLNINQSVSGSFVGSITDGATRTLAIGKTGASSLVLTQANNYSGGTTVTTGKLVSGAPGTLGSAQVTLNGGTLSLGQSISGFGSIGTGWTVNQAGTYTNTPTAITADTLTLTDGTAAGNQGRFAFDATPVSISSAAGFTANFVYGLGAARVADGLAFVLENDPRGSNIVNGTGGSLGVAGTTNSSEIVFKLFSNVSLTGIGTNGVFNASNDMTTGGVNLHTGGPFNVALSYNGPANTLTETVTDQANTSNTFTTTYTSVNLQSALAGTSAYVGFTGSDGGSVSNQTVSGFTLQSSAGATWGNNVLASANTSSGIELGVGSVAIGNLTVQGGATVNLTTTAATRQALSVGVLDLTGGTNSSTGKLQLGSNSLVVRGGSLATVTNQVGQGYANGSWQGSAGVVSSTAAADSTHLTALGVILNTADGSTPLYPSFGGLFNVAATDVLVKYTYYGDADLSGVVDGSDYSRIDNGSVMGLTGWFNGDFNYDGVINGSDYTLIDNAFNTQGASLAAGIASPSAFATAQVAGTSSVPEPTTLGLLGIGAAGLLGRRSRRRARAGH